MFQGFTQQTSDFFFQIAFNNERPWFLAHKEQYEEFVNKPMKELAADTLAIMRDRWESEDFSVHISRIYRDARRLFGRGPYKDHMWFTVQRGKLHAQVPTFWFEVDADSYSYGVGGWDATPTQMEVFRRRIDANPAGFERMVDKLTGEEGFRLWGTEYKRPKGDRGEKLNPWYNRRSVSAGYEFQFGGDALSPKLPEIIADAYGRLMPLWRFMMEVYRLAGEQGEDQ